jgi:thiamine pyrophosphate-dependent acetolactate synthase large subunit-like protein
MTRARAVARVADLVPAGALTIVCNGMIGRELYTHRDQPSQFYMIGSMGLASSIGLGLALARPDRTIVVFDGDGNVLMGLGALASVAAEAPANLYHVVFDNHVHGSTGGQRTIADRVPLEDVALAAGYRAAARVADFDAIAPAVRSLFTEPGPAMLLIEVEAGNQDGVGRVEPSPAALTERFRRAAASGSVGPSL